ncbi:MAG TPA: hypothetical protein VL495_09075 [Edaphobacter sp.]|jgi:hypothetical protein|nr:hypothetical protein [Edaphobacter sp.]
MTQTSQGAQISREAQNAQVRFFGVPIGDLGWFASLLIGAAAGFSAFFAATFLGIVSIMIYNSTGHNVDYAYSYQRGGLTAGILVLVASWAYLGTLWVRRITRRS